MYTPQPDDPRATELDRELIRRTYAIADGALDNLNHPFGALLYLDGRIVLEHENRVDTSKDVTRHAEVGLISAAARKLDRHSLSRCAIYCSSEPCLMCSGAIYWAGIKKIVYGISTRGMVAALDGRYDGIPCAEVFRRIDPAALVIGPVLEETGIKIHLNYWPRPYRAL